MTFKFDPYLQDWVPDSLNPLITKCGRALGRGYKMFTPETLKQHELDCPTCKAITQGVEIDTDDYDDSSDGAHFAMQAEDAPKG